MRSDTFPPAGDDASDTPRTVLIADDDADQRLLLKRLLQRAGFETVTAESGEDALAYARARRPDVIVLDVQMPGQGGLATGRQLKADPALADVPLIFLTGRVKPDELREALRIGAREFLPKSVALAQLVERVRELSQP